MTSCDVRPLSPSDREAWQPLYQGYLAFYGREYQRPLADVIWQRFHDPAEPMFALGAFVEDDLLGIVHFIFHRTCGSVADTCYLQDLFTASEARGRGMGRALIEAVADRAREAGSARVYWLTQETNSTARLLYDKVGKNLGFIQYRIDL